MTLLIVLVFILISLSVWNLKSLYDLKKFNKSEQKLKDDKYYELKYKLEFITTIAIVVIGVGGFFGYKVSDEVNLKADKLKTRLDLLDSLIQVKKDNLFTYDTMSKSLSTRLTYISNKINVISNKNIIKQDFFISDNLRFVLAEDTISVARFDFKNLKTLTGDPFPTFDKPPFLVLVPENSAEINLIYLDKDYFKVSCGASMEYDKSAIFGIVVSKK